MKIEYGRDDRRWDVTQLASKFITNNKHLHIPAGDQARAAVFSDVLPGVLKSVFIEGFEVPASVDLVVDLSTGTAWVGGSIPWDVAGELLFSPDEKLITDCP